MSSNKTRSKRLRKKIYVDEFSIVGFKFSCKVGLELDSEFNDFFDGLIEVIESRNLCIAGSGDNGSFEGVVSSRYRYGSSTEEDRTAIENWLSAKNGVSDISVGNLVDAIYGL